MSGSAVTRCAFPFIYRTKLGAERAKPQEKGRWIWLRKCRRSAGSSKRRALTELNAPEGYELADPIDFIIQNGKVYRFVIDESGASEKEEVTEVTIVMVDKKSTETTTTTTTTTTKNRVDQDDQNVTTTTTVKVATGNKTNNQNQSSSSSSGNRTSGTTNVRTASSPKTGDNTNIWLPILLLVISTGGMAGLYICRKRKSK